MDFVIWVLFFYIYSFLGWICEVVYCFIYERKLVNRGFFVGPIVPIYGWGAVLVLIVLSPLSNQWYLIFLLGFLLTSILEYVTSYIMEKMFKIRLWDYSHHKFNIHGRVSLKNSTLFGILVILLIYLIHPIIENSINVISSTLIITFVIILSIIIMTDIIYSFTTLGKLSRYIKKLKVINENIELYYRNRITRRLIWKFPTIRTNKSQKKSEIKEKYLDSNKKI